MSADDSQDPKRLPIADWQEEIGSFLFSSHSLCLALFEHPGRLLFANPAIQQLFKDDPAASIINPDFASLWQLPPLNGSLLRLGRWDLSIAQEENQPWGDSAEVDALPIINQLQQAKMAFRPEILESSGKTPQLNFPALRLRYTTTFNYQSSARVTLALEPGSLKGDWRCELNESWSATAEQFQPAGAGVHTPGTLGLDITTALKPGLNRLVFSVQARDPDDGLRNPLYLAGDFAVQAGSRTISPPRTSGAFEQYEDNGLPFFSGTIEYSGVFVASELPAAPFCQLRLALPCPCEEALEISVNASPWLALPWNPRQAVIPVKLLRRGKNDFRLRLSTTLIRAFEGEAFDISRHSLVTVS